jgi:phage repressor protein C with HTH and peptisase S24 domain
MRRRIRTPKRRNRNRYHADSITELSGITALDALQVEGNALAPELQDGQYVRVEPSHVSKPGDLVVAAIRSEKVVLIRQNGDGELTNHKGGYIPAGQWRPLGIVTAVLLPE